jgi:ribose transport system permease protein
MKKLIGLLLFAIGLYLAVFVKVPEGNDNRTKNNVNMARRMSQLGIVSLGAGTLIIAGGIDLSIGSFMGLCATVLAVGMQRQGWSPPQAIAVVLGMGVVVGLIHGLLVTKLRLPAFIVTLCGLFIYRGLARWWAGDANAGIGPGMFKRAFSEATPFGLPVEFIYLVVAAIVFYLLLQRSIYGRYLYAIGSNELAAKYSGIRVDRYKIFAYVLCSLTAAFYSMMHLAEVASVSPSNVGSMLELYAIAGAVIGGCSLRGGEGNVLGIILGASILTLLQAVVSFWDVPQSLEYAAIGGALLVGAIMDEVLRRRGPATAHG